jgi:hypothetical protein
MYWLILIIIGGLLGFGFMVDYIVKKRKIKMDPEERAKNAPELERELYLHLTKQHSNDISTGPL